MLEWFLARDRFAHVLLTKTDKLNRRTHARLARHTAACSDTSVTCNCSQLIEKEGLERRASHGSRLQSHKKGPVVTLKQPPRQTNPAWG